MAGRAYISPYTLDENQLAMVRQTFPDYKIEVAQAPLNHPHPISAIERAIGERVATNYAASVGQPGTILLEVGGSIVRQARAGCTHHSCSPVLEIEDVSRSARDEVRLDQPEFRRRNQVLDQGRVVYAEICDGFTYCRHTIQQCTCVPHDRIRAMLYIHSLYYFSPNDVLQHMVDKHVTRAVALTHVFEKPFGDLWTVGGHQPEATFEIDQHNNYVMQVHGNCAGPYVGSNPSWLKSQAIYQTRTHTLSWNQVAKLGSSFVFEFFLTNTTVYYPPRPILNMTDIVHNSDYFQGFSYDMSKDQTMAPQIDHVLVPTNPTNVFVNIYNYVRRVMKRHRTTDRFYWPWETAETPVVHAVSMFGYLVCGHGMYRHAVVPKIALAEVTSKFIGRQLDASSIITATSHATQSISKCNLPVKYRSEAVAWTASLALSQAVYYSQNTFDIVLAPLSSDAYAYNQQAKSFATFAAAKTNYKPYLLATAAFIVVAFLKYKYMYPAESLQHLLAASQQLPGKNKTLRDVLMNLVADLKSRLSFRVPQLVDLQQSTKNVLLSTVEATARASTIMVTACSAATTHVLTWSWYGYSQLMRVILRRDKNLYPPLFTHIDGPSHFSNVVGRHRGFFSDLLDLLIGRTTVTTPMLLHIIAGAATEEIIKKRVMGPTLFALLETSLDNNRSILNCFIRIIDHNLYTLMPLPLGILFHVLNNYISFQLFLQTNSSPKAIALVLVGFVIYKIYKWYKQPPPPPTYNRQFDDAMLQRVSPFFPQPLAVTRDALLSVNPPIDYDTSMRDGAEIKFLDKLDERNPRPLMQAVGVVTDNPPIVPANNLLGTLAGVHKRTTRPLLPAPLEADFVNFWKNQKAARFPHTHVIDDEITCDRALSIISFRAWNNRFTASQQRNHIRALENASLLEVHRNAFVKTLIVKSEKLDQKKASDGTLDNIARIVIGNSDLMSALTGPPLYSYHKMCMTLFNNPSNFHDGVCWIYAPGNDITQLSALFSQAYEELLATCDPGYEVFLLKFDGSFWDACVRDTYKGVEIEHYKALQFAREVIVALYGELSVRMFSKTGVFVQTNNLRSSGMHNTTSANTELNLAAQTFAIKRAYPNSTAVVMCAGDDAVLVVAADEKDPDVVCRMIEQNLSDIGLKPKIETCDRLQDIEFCSMAFVPVQPFSATIMGVVDSDEHLIIVDRATPAFVTRLSNYVFSPMPHRIMNRLGFSTGIGNADTKGYMKSVCLSMHNACAHLPVVSCMLEHLLDMCKTSAGVTLRGADAHKSHFTLSKRQYANPDTIAWFCEKYATTEEEIKGLEEVIKTINSIPVHLQHPLLNKLTADFLPG